MGKSTAASFLLQAGFQVVDTDDLARELVQLGQPALAEISQEFGQTIFLADGNLNRRDLARIVFSNPSARKKLESILHPRIRERWSSEIKHWRENSINLGFVVIPLLFETQVEAQFDRIICVACSTGQQQERLRQRGWTPVQIKQRQSAQWSIEKKLSLSHYVVWTEGEPAVSQEQLRRIIPRL